MSNTYCQAKIAVTYWRKPIPTDRYDYEARFEGDDENGPCGYGSTEQAAIAELHAEAEFRAS